MVCAVVPRPRRGGPCSVLIPVEWTDDGWPVLGKDGKSVDEILPMPVKVKSAKTDIVTSDEFNNGPTRHIFAASEVGSRDHGGIAAQENQRAGKG